MGLFNKFKHAKKEFDKKVEILDAPAGASKADPIWKLRTINDINIAMCNRLTSKTNYGENMEVLCEEERIFYIATEIDSQVHSLGFDQFFFDVHCSFLLFYLFNSLNGSYGSPVHSRPT